MNKIHSSSEPANLVFIKGIVRQMSMHEKQGFLPTLQCRLETSNYRGFIGTIIRIYLIGSQARFGYTLIEIEDYLEVNGILTYREPFHGSTTSEGQIICQEFYHLGPIHSYRKLFLYK